MKCVCGTKLCKPKMVSDILDHPVLQMPISLPVISSADTFAELYLFINASFNACSHILLIRPKSNIELNASLSSPVITPTD